MNKHKEKQGLDLLQSSDAPTCDTHVVHLDNVRSTQAEILATDKAQQMAEIFGVLADTNRLRLLSALASQELCVCDLAVLTKMSESAVCHQLRLLKVMRLVSYRREGRNVYYSLADSHIINLYRSLLEHLDESNV
ncbi:transcription repressor SmtB [Scytonema sp. HK-05]|uniref:ArsR/SmtB family transcription factor n=1 Tax=Scytonema sp. HK-05 TaxID=1137095 RepID=UPI00093671B3|nr:metalloregulator ArsR/SmtB family transcription factor [Scytonema sp. HK-05]OKH59681.1 ArsR family transcriptional regulator [Scytonema sp. HK-05]BAY47917.1 transcription repressor SmtB [Scytonema sp. HK-05]